MINEIFLKKSYLQKIPHFIEKVRKKGEVLIIRSNDMKFSKEDWFNFLTKNCKLQPDRRHYNYDQTIDFIDWYKITNEKSKSTSFTFSTTKQPLHNDNAFFENGANINFFYMEKQVEHGGEQIIYFVDKLVQDLKEKNKALLKQLLVEKVLISKGNDEFKNHTEILKIKPYPMSFWNYFRTVKKCKKINNLCENFFDFVENKSISSHKSIKLFNNDCMVFNDKRILHGRNAFSAKNENDRILYQSMWN